MEFQTSRSRSTLGPSNPGEYVVYENASETVPFVIPIEIAVSGASARSSTNGATRAVIR